MNNDFQHFGNELTAHVKKNNFSFSKIISEKRKKKKKIEIRLPSMNWSN